MVTVDPTEVLRGHRLLERFEALDRWLSERRGLWHPRPFSQLSVPWAEDHPELARWLIAQDEATVDAIDAAAAGVAMEGDPPATDAEVAAGPTATTEPAATGSAEPLRLPDLPQPLARWLREAGELCALEAWPRDRGLAPGLRAARLRRGVRGRKWEQVVSFAGAVLPLPTRCDRLLDWCGGQGHLGRTLAAVTGLPVTVVDRDERLRERALHLARRTGAELSFVQADALDPGARRHLRHGQSVVALHACGGLANALIAGVEEAGVPEVALAPCCFHLKHGARDGRQPQSAAGREAALTLDHTALRLATSDEVLASKEQRAKRRRESAWRTGLDLLLRQASGEDRYTPLGPLPRAVLELPFGEFCRAVATSRGWVLPAMGSDTAARQLGEERARQARALAVVRAVFRRPLELWLALDRALALVERGYEVGVGVFCAPQVSPRNVLIRATAP